jgi:predicted nucleic acid-binding protein
LILDTDVLIDLLRNKPNALVWFAALSVKPNVSIVAVLEVLFGARDRFELRRIQAFLQGFPVTWCTAADFQLAMSYARLRLANGMGILDALTAAAAIRTNQQLVTFNVKHFAGVPNLTMAQPYVH